MADPITPDALAEARELGAKFGDVTLDWRKRWGCDFGDHGLAELIAHIRAAATAAERERIAAQWDGCTVEEIGGIVDVGRAIRSQH